MLVGRDYTLVANLGQEGLLINDLVISIKKPSSTEFEPAKEVLPFQVVEAEEGLYNIKIDKEDIPEIGIYYFKLEAYEFNTLIKQEATYDPRTGAVPPSLCVVTGTIRNLSGDVKVFEGVEVTARLLNLPKFIDGNLIVSDRVRTFTNFEGFFSLPLIRGSKVIFEIKATGKRFQTTIPDTDLVSIEDLDNF